MVTRGVDGKVTPVRKGTRFAVSSKLILEALSRKCDRSHSHQHLLDGRSRSAHVYPAQLCRAILVEIEKQRQGEGQTMPEAHLGRLESGCAVYDLGGDEGDRVTVDDES